VLQSPSQTPGLALFDVVITEFDARAEGPVPRIVRVFGVEEPTAEALVAALPAMVCQAVNQVRAAHFARALHSIGAHIEVRDQSGALIDVSEWLDSAPSSDEMHAEPAAANDNDGPSRPRSEPLFHEGDALADTLGGTPAPAHMSQAEIEALQHEPTAPRIATPQPASAATAGWGELQREPQRARAPSQSLPAAIEQLPSELLVPQSSGAMGPRELTAEDVPGDRLSLEPPSHAAARAGSRPLTAAGQHPAMRGGSRPLTGQLTQPLTAAEPADARRGARPPRESSAKLAKAGEPAGFSGAEQPNDWADFGLPELEANTVEDAGASGAALGPSTAGQGPRLHALDLSGPALSLDPSALRAVATRGGVSYEAGPGRARKPGVEDAELARGLAARAREDSAALPRGRGGAGSRGARGTDNSAAGRGTSGDAGASARRGGRASGDEARSAGGDAAARGGASRDEGARGRQESSALRGGGVDRDAGARAAGARGANAARTARAAHSGAAAASGGDDARAQERAGARGAGNQRSSSARREDAGSAPHHADASEFWESFSDCLGFPFRGSGIAWLVSIAIWAIAASALSVLAWVAPIAGWTVMFFANSSVLAICADYHRRCMWAVANHDGMLVQGPEFDPTHIMREYVRAGANIAAFAALSQLPLALWLAIAIGHDGQRMLDLTFSARFWLLAALPSLYWPAAMASASLYNRAAGVWFVPVGIRAIVRAPLMYFAIFGAGVATFIVPWLLFAAIAREAGIPGSLMLAIAGLPMAASHGVMGALTGLLMRSKPESFA
jgi:hypothetical protein